MCHLDRELRKKDEGRSKKRGDSTRVKVVTRERYERPR
jgi:hypothetical protein